jgi:zinc transport system permease protein
VLGVVGSFYANTAPGPSIVVLALAGFALSWPLAALLRQRRRIHAPFDAAAAGERAPEAQKAAEAHAHVHGPGCGHPAVRHGDHVDYVHHGHRHATHDDHYDEH